MRPADLGLARVNQGFSRRALSRAIDVPEQTLRRAEAGLGISPQYAKRIADHFGLRVTDIWDIDELIGGVKRQDFARDGNEPTGVA